MLYNLVFELYKISNYNKIYFSILLHIPSWLLVVTFALN